jgi:hypothetical protein
MRTSEWIQIVLASVLALAAWITSLTSHPLPLRRRWVVTGLAVIAIVIVELGRFSASFVIKVQCGKLAENWRRPEKETQSSVGGRCVRMHLAEHSV